MKSSGNVVPLSLAPTDARRSRRRNPRGAAQRLHDTIYEAIIAGAIGPVLRGIRHPLAGSVEQYFATEFQFATPEEPQPRCLTFPERHTMGRLIAPWARLGHATADDVLISVLLSAIERQGVSRADIRSLYGEERASRVLQALEQRADGYQECYGTTVSLRVFAASEIAILLLHRPTDAFPERI